MQEDNHATALWFLRQPVGQQYDFLWQIERDVRMVGGRCVRAPSARVYQADEQAKLAAMVECGCRLPFVGAMAADRVVPLAEIECRSTAPLTCGHR